MDVAKIPIGRKPPDDVNVIVEIPQGGEPVKYELDKEKAPADPPRGRPIPSLRSPPFFIMEFPNLAAVMKAFDQGHPTSQGSLAILVLHLLTMSPNDGS